MTSVAGRAQAGIVALLAAAIGLGVHACASSPCEDCPGGNIFLDLPEDDPYEGHGTVKWELDLDGDRYEMTCSSLPGVESSDRPEEGLALVCEGNRIVLGWDVDLLRVQAVEVNGQWSTNGWHEFRPGGGAPCRCSLFEVAVPIVYPSGSQ